MPERDYSQDVKINRFKLETECEEQPSIYLYWGEKLADARNAVDQAKERLDLLMADREIYYRDPDNMPFGVKVSADAVKAVILKDEKVTKRRKELNTAKADLNVLEVAVKALEHKRTMLGHLHDLFLAGYYADPSRRKTGTDEAGDNARAQLKRSGA